MHAAYRCRHRGACCQAGWDIDLEPHVVEAVTSGKVIPLTAGSVPLVPHHDEAGRMSLARTADGWCGFRNDHRCSLQRAGGEAMLPSACRHFPRLVLRDGRGMLLALSHFCPTAAAMLFDERPLTIVETCAPLAPEEPIEGLDARNALPPLVRPGMLADIEGYAAWEEAVVREFTDAPSAARALERIAAATESVRNWTPAHGALAASVAAAFADARREPLDEDLSEAFGILREVTGPHPLLHVEAGFLDAWRALHAGAGPMLRRPVANYMAACAFGNWTAYRGQGLRTVVAWLRGCYDVLRVQLVRQAQSPGSLDITGLTEAFRMADFILVHNVPSIEFGRAAVVFEQSASAAQAGGS
jgi:hypothetical protein